MRGCSWPPLVLCVLSTVAMTTDLLTDLGEEYLMKNGFDGIVVTVGVYNDSTDQLGDGSDTGSITTEPSNTNYGPASVGISATDLSGDWGVRNDATFSFDFSDTTVSKDVDAVYVEYAFQASDTGDTSSVTHLLANPALSQTRDIGSIDTLEIAAGDLQIQVD